MIFLEVCISFDPALQGDEWVGGEEGWVGVRGREVGREETGEDTGPPVTLR